MSRNLENDCIYNDSDEDCNKCVKHGYIFSCGGCKDYTDHFGRPMPEEEQEDE